MSRCFPLQRENREAFVELNKPQKEKEEPKIEKRKEKKLSKLRKENELDKRRQGSETDHKVKKPKDEKKHHQLGKSADFIAKYPSKKRVVDESENSGVTEELEQPTDSSVCYVSNDAQSGNKRKRQDSSANGNQTQRIILRLKLPLRKHSEASSSSSEQYKRCHSAGPETTQDKTTLSHTNSGEKVCYTGAQTNIDIEQLNPKPCLELPVLAQERTHTKTEKTSFCSNEMKCVKSAYKTLIENWVPGSLTQLLQDDVEDQDWLFGSRKQQDKQESKRPKADIEQLFLTSSASWPQARYLPVVDIRALPYTVPF